MITQTFDLNLIPRQAPVVVHCDQYDHGTGRLIIKLYNNSVAYTPSGTAVIQGKKPDGHGFIYNATMSGNTVTADLTEQMTAVDGDVRCQVVVTETTGRTGSFDFILRVQHSALPDDTEMSDSDYQLIEQALESVEDSEAWAVGERDGIPVGPDDITYHNNSKWWAEQSGGGGATSLSSLTDVNLSTLTDGEVLEYDGTTHKWENKGLTIPDDLNDLTDVSTSSPTNGQGLIYNTTSGKWENQNIPSGGASDLDDLTDVTLTTPTNGQVLQYDGSKWVNANGGGGGSSTLSGLTDVSVASLVNGNYLRYNATSTKWENTWNDFSTDSLASLDAFVQGTANNAQSAHCFGTFFKVKDINNVFGLGANEWLRGYVVYQNITSNTYNNIGGAGILYKNASGDPYKFYIGGGGTVEYPWIVTVNAISGGASALNDLTDVDVTGYIFDNQSLVYDSTAQKWKAAYNSEGLYGFTPITSTNADVNDLTNAGNYYKSDTSFALTHYANSSANIQVFITVKTLFDGDVVVFQEAIERSTSTTTTLPSNKRFRRGVYDTNAQEMRWSTWSMYESTTGATDKAKSYGGEFSSVVTCQTGDTTATFTDATYDSSWTYDVYCDDGTGTPIAISSIVVNASNQVVVTFASGLTATTSVKLHYWS